MLRIGFTNTFFTLWDVTTQTEYSGGLPYKKTVYTYYQNLSVNEESAQLKAKEMGVINLEVDHELHGLSTSWTKTEELFSKMPQGKDPYFQFGKYSNTPILESKDEWYLKWYWEETKNIYAIQLLVDLGYTEVDGYLYDEDEVDEARERQASEKEMVMMMKEIKKSTLGRIVFTPERNLDERGMIEYNNRLVIFRKFREMNYNGHGYSLPVVDSTGRRIKNKELILLVRVIDNPFIEEDALEVLKVESINGTKF